MFILAVNNGNDEEIMLIGWGQEPASYELVKQDSLQKCTT